MVDKGDIKLEARESADYLPNSATRDDLAYEVRVRHAIELGLADVGAGRMVAHGDAVARIRSWIRLPS